MKSKVRYSLFATVLTAVLFAALFIGCIATLHEEPAFFTLLALYVILIIAGVLCGPAYINATPDAIILGSIFKKRKLAMRDVASVELFKPTLGAIRIFASGGFMGYWGIFREGDIGRYYAFYGKASDCFLVCMKNGDKYVLGCENPEAITEYINSQLS